MATLGKMIVTLTCRTTPFMKGMAKASKRLDKFGSQAQGIGLRLGAVGAAPLMFGLKNAVAYEQQMANLATMLDDMGMKHLPNFSKGVRQLSMDTGEATETLNKGLYDILSASIEPSKALFVLGASAKGAAAGLTDTGISVDAVTTLLNSYKLGAEAAYDVSDLLFAIVKRAKTNFEMLAPAIGSSAAIAAVFNMRLEDMAAFLATASRAGIPIEQLPTSLRATVMSFAKATDDAKKAARKYGIVLSTETLRSKGLLWVLEKLKNARKDELAEIFPQVRALKGLAATLQDVEGFAYDYSVMLKRAGMMQEAYEKQTNTVRFQLGRLWQIVNDVGRGFGMAYLPKLKDVVTWMSKWIIKNREMIVGGAKAAVGLLKVAGGLLAMAATVKTLAFLLSPAGVITTMVGGILFMLDALNVVNLGWRDLLGSIRIGGREIQTWLTEAWLFAAEGWAIATTRMKKDWETFKSLVEKGVPGWKAVGVGVVQELGQEAMKFQTDVVKGLTWLSALLEGETAESRSNLMRAWDRDFDKWKVQWHGSFQKWWDGFVALFPGWAPSLTRGVNELNKKLAESRALLADARAQNLVDDLARANTEAADLNQRMKDYKPPAWDTSEMAEQLKGLRGLLELPGAWEKGTREAYSVATKPMYQAMERYHLEKETAKAAKKTAKNTDVLPDILRAVEDNQLDVVRI